MEISEHCKNRAPTASNPTHAMSQHDGADDDGGTAAMDPSPSPPPPPPPPVVAWPEDGVLTREWVADLTAALDWCSRRLPADQLPSVLPAALVQRLVVAASVILHREPNIVRADPRPDQTVVVVGDVHGQLHDVIFLLQDAGFPSEERIFVFNGDYVDRGAWGLETLLLLAWKVLLQKSVFLLRGNHESKYCTSVYGFEQEVMVKYKDQGPQVYRKFLRCFEDLPLASIIAGCVYTAHGGIFRGTIVVPSKRSKKGKRGHKYKANSTDDSTTIKLGSLDELLKARRTVLDPPWEGSNLIPGDVLWSDPSLEMGLSPNKERGIGLIWGPDITQQLEKERAYPSHAYRDFSVDRPDVEHDRQRRRLEKEKEQKVERDRRDYERDEKDGEHDSRELDVGQRKRKPFPRKTEDPTGAETHQGGGPENHGIHSISASSYDNMDALESVYTQEFHFCEIVKEKLEHDAYQEFLKCLHIYSQEIITRSELNNLVNDILQHHPDLMDGFNEFLEHCENIDGFLAGVFNKRQTGRLVKTEDKERNKEHEREDRDRDRKKERASHKPSALPSKEKYNLCKPISELDLSNCQRCTPSYRLLPKNYTMPPASNRIVK